MKRLLIMSLITILSTTFVTLDNYDHDMGTIDSRFADGE